MNVWLNGEPVEMEAGSSVADAVTALDQSVGSSGVAVALGGEVVPRSEWSERRLADGDRVEVVHAVQGG